MSANLGREREPKSDGKLGYLVLSLPRNQMHTQKGTLVRTLCTPFKYVVAHKSPKDFLGKFGLIIPRPN